MREIYIDTSNLSCYRYYMSIYSYNYTYKLRYKDSSVDDPFIVSLRENKINRWYYDNGTYFINENDEVFKLVIRGFFYGEDLITDYTINILNSLNIKEIKIDQDLLYHDPYDYKYWAILLLSDYYDIDKLDIIHIASVMKEIYKVIGIGHVKELQEKFMTMSSFLSDNKCTYLSDIYVPNDKFKESIIMSINNAMNNKASKEYLDAYCKLHFKDGIFLGSYSIDAENNTIPKDKKRFDRVHVSFAIKSDREKVRGYIKNGNFREEILRPIFNYNMKGYSNLMKMYGATITKYDRLICSFCFKDEVEKLLSK